MCVLIITTTVLFLLLSEWILCVLSKLNQFGCFYCIFSARQHAECAICYCKSICLSVTWVDQSKTFKVRIMPF